MIARENAQVAYLQNPALWPFKTICPVRRNTVRGSGGRVPRHEYDSIAALVAAGWIVG